MEGKSSFVITQQKLVIQGKLLKVISSLFLTRRPWVLKELHTRRRYSSLF